MRPGAGRQSLARHNLLDGSVGKRRERSRDAFGINMDALRIGLAAIRCDSGPSRVRHRK
jgi:hypothetical protein